MSFNKEQKVWDFLVGSGEWPLKDYEEVKLPDNIILVKCGRYPKCKNYCLDRKWAKYDVCSERCESLADDEYGDYENENL